MSSKLKLALCSGLNNSQTKDNMHVVLVKNTK